MRFRRVSEWFLFNTTVKCIYFICWRRISSEYQYPLVTYSVWPIIPADSFWRLCHAWDTLRTPKSIWPPQACRSLGSRASGNSWAVDSREAGSLPSCPGFREYTWVECRDLDNRVASRSVGGYSPVLCRVDSNRAERIWNRSVAICTDNSRVVDKLWGSAAYSTRESRSHRGTPGLPRDLTGA